MHTHDPDRARSLTPATAATSTRKDIAVAFLQCIASGAVQTAFSEYVAPGFRHHNPLFAGDAQSLMVAMEENAANNPDRIFQVKRALEDHELVAVHSHMQQNPDESGMSVVHIFRFQAGRIVEMWDVCQSIPDSSPNTNGMY
jgi:predicted SnoaL-like aldol condensation-catalyzing enzyme